MAAFYISGIDNALVAIICEEVPIMDGSAKEFLTILSSAEITTLSEKRKYLKISKKLELVDGKRKISIEPNNNSLEVDFQLDYENRLIGKQKNIVETEGPPSTQNTVTIDCFFRKKYTITTAI